MPDMEPSYGSVAIRVHISKLLLDILDVSNYEFETDLMSSDRFCLSTLHWL